MQLVRTLILANEICLEICLEGVEISEDIIKRITNSTKLNILHYAICHRKKQIKILDKT